MATNFNIFEGNNECSPGNLDGLPDAPPPWRDLATSKRSELRGKTYKASENEIELVNAALLLRRPLLVEGFPGVGKSSLAYAVAYELGLGDEEAACAVGACPVMKEGEAVGRRPVDE